jgi:hypothetical protein
MLSIRSRRPDRNADRDGPSRADRRPDFSEVHNFSGGWNPERLKVYERLGGAETPEKLAETEQFATVERGMFLHKKGARQPDALNPDNWAMDAYAFSIEANRVFMSRLFMNLATNTPHYPEWNAYLKDRQPKTLIVWGAK